MVFSGCGVEFASIRATTRNDVTGLSVSRAKYKSIQDAAKGLRGKAYYVAVLRAGDLRQDRHPSQCRLRVPVIRDTPSYQT